jgi:hypothetical protein
MSTTLEVDASLFRVVNVDALICFSYLRLVLPLDHRRRFRSIDGGVGVATSVQLDNRNFVVSLLFVVRDKAAHTAAAVAAAVTRATISVSVSVSLLCSLLVLDFGLGLGLGLGLGSRRPQ